MKVVKLGAVGRKGTASVMDAAFFGVVAKNSVGFIETVFSCLSRKIPVVILKGSEDPALVSTMHLSETIDPDSAGGWASLPFKPDFSDEVAQIAFTSGTEGKPKGILITHANLADMVERLNSVMHMDSSIKEYVGVPVYHSFGFGRCRAVATVGGKFFIPPQGFNPLEIKNMLLEQQINAISAVPSLWRVLFDCEEIFGEETRRVKWIEIGSQYMSAEEKLRLKALFPNAVIVQHYGLTEASRATFLQIHKEDAFCALESVGCPVGDTQIKITADGCIAIRGSLVAGYCLNEGRRDSLVDAAGWLVTRDLGELHGGYLKYKGRADDVINCGGVKISPDDLENRVRSISGLKQGFACCRIPDALRGQSVLVCYTGELAAHSASLEAAAVQALAELNVTPGKSLKLMQVDLLPITPTGKVKRKELTQLYVAQQALSKQKSAAATVSPALPPGLSAREQELVQLWKDLLNLETLEVDESFLDLGGDSLTAISAIVKMKRLGIPETTCRGILQGKSIAEIVLAEQQLTQARAKQPDLTLPRARALKDALSIKVVRGLLVLLVIFAHWAEGLFQRLPESMAGLWSLLAPVFSFGTPGFAIMYGLAMGYSVYPLYCRSPTRVRGLIWPIFSVLFCGILLLAGAELLQRHVTDGVQNITQVANSFYNVLSYYLLATLSLYFWFWILKASRAPVLAALIGALLLHLFYLRFMAPLTAVPAEGFIELGKLLIAAKYSYFNMTSGVFLGLGVGIALSGSKQFSLTMPAAIWLGVATILCAWLLSDITGNAASWFIWPGDTVQSWKWLFYFGVCVLLLVGMDRLLNYYHRMPSVAARLLNVLACFGLLAFPLFVMHKLVLPIKDLLEVVGLSGVLAVGLSMGLFVGLSGYMLYRSYRLQFD